MDTALLVEGRRGPACILTLNRPSARNSLSLDLSAALNDAIDRAGAIPEVAAIIITGAPPAFCSGHDLRELTARRQDPDRGRAFFEQTMRSCSALMQAIVACQKPVIAAVNGIATAAGCQLVASCDLAVAGESAQLRHARRGYRPVLLDADGGPVAQYLAQGGDGDAASW